LFADAESAIAHEFIPDANGEVEPELTRYKAFRFATRIGFRPPICTTGS